METTQRQIKIIVVLCVSLYIIFALYLYVAHNRPPIDYLLWTVLILWYVMFTKHMRISVKTLVFGILATLPHSIGVFPFMYHGQYISLYHDVILGGNYDLISHVVSFFFLTLALRDLYMRNHRLPALGRITFVLMLIGIGAVVELTEFGGYAFFGFGYGAFQFGAGDNSNMFGPWGDSMLDICANIVGIATALLLSNIRTKNHSKSAIRQRGASPLHT